ncbi:MAG: hypothetical protein V7K89_00595 [Nostoc sp.]|uniref:hypothetical protein n=1 Tax=Nostoc sp. TaxID=1180 RepID=UPI002FF9686D
MLNLLAVDFDFFFPNYADNSQHPHWYLYDWIYDESISEFHKNEMWKARARKFWENNLPLPKLVDNYLNFWERFNFAPDCVLYYSDSNVYAAHADVVENVSCVYLFDAHHDCGYSRPFGEFLQQKSVGCGNWMLVYWLRNATLIMRYPQWRVKAFETEPEPKIPVDRKFDCGKTIKTVFHKVALCRSGPWVPPWCDTEFWNFLDKAPIINKICLERFMQTRKFEFDEAQ